MKKFLIGYQSFNERGAITGNLIAKKVLIATPERGNEPIRDNETLLVVDFASYEELQKQLETVRASLEVQEKELVPAYVRELRARVADLESSVNGYRAQFENERAMAELYAADVAMMKAELGRRQRTEIGRG